MQVPEQVHPYSSSVRGGIVGGIAMAVVAPVYGLVSGRGIWYPVNLLAAMLMPAIADSDRRGAREIRRHGARCWALSFMESFRPRAGLVYGMLLAHAASLARLVGRHRGTASMDGRGLQLHGRA